MKSKTRIDVNKTPVADSHCHIFLPIQKRLNMSDLCRMYYMGQLRDLEVARELECKFIKTPVPFVSRLILELGKLYREEEWAMSHLPKEAESILEERYERVQNYSEYIKFLYDDISLQSMVVDLGYPEPPQPTTGEIPILERFKKEVNGSPPHIVHLFRIETLTDELLEKKETFSAFLSHWDASIEEALKNTNNRGFKSVIAYRTGLDVRPWSRDEAGRNYEAYQRDPAANIKPLMDFLCLRAMERTIEFNKVFQVHSGMGDLDIIAEKAHPLCIIELFKKPPFSELKFVLVHAGHPWVMEAAQMCALLPNVYMDVSMGVPFYSFGMDLRLLEALEAAPIDKILYGSDGFLLPEIHWIAGKLFKESLQSVFDQLIEKKQITQSQAQDSAEKILYKNATQLYTID